MAWLDQMTEFSLEREVEKFVKSRIRALAQDKHEFSFEGHSHTSVCPMHGNTSHVPHVTGHYSTVRAGTLQYFCTGEEGIVESGHRLHIVIEGSGRGSPEDAAWACGFWYLTEE